MSAALVNQTNVGGKDVLDPNVLPAYFREGKESFFHRCSLHSVLTQPSLGQQLVRVGKDVSIVMLIAEDTRYVRQQRHLMLSKRPSGGI
jgi:hypothetical protein